MTKSKEYAVNKSRQGVKIFYDYINKITHNNNIYNYECLGTIDEYCPYDMMIIKRDKENWGNYSTTYHEIKTREDNIGINDFETSVIDYKKIITLQKIASQTGSRAFINIIYPKNRKILQWEITPDIKYQIENKQVNWQSQSYEQNREIKLNKILVHLNINEAKKYSY